MSNYVKGWYSKPLTDDDAKMCTNPDFTAFRTKEFSSDSYVLGKLKLNESQVKRIAYACKKPLNQIDLDQFKKAARADMSLQGLNHAILHSKDGQAPFIYLTRERMNE